MRPWVVTGAHNGMAYPRIVANGQTQTGFGPIYYDRDRPTIFPAGSVLPIGELRDVVPEWVRTGERPTGVEWQAVNSLTWDLPEGGGS